MPSTATVDSTISLNGRVYRRQASIVADGVVEKSPTVAAAVTGTLTVRTDADTGSLTLTTGHGVTTGARLDVYWTGGQRRGMVVGTVATNVVPIDAGSGDNLPTAATAVSVMVAREEAFSVVGSSLAAVGATSPVLGQVVFADASNVELYAKVLAAGIGWFWDSGSDAANPISGTVAKVFFSHGDPAAQTMSVGAIYA